MYQPKFHMSKKSKNLIQYPDRIDSQKLALRRKVFRFLLPEVVVNKLKHKTLDPSEGVQINRLKHKYHGELDKRIWRGTETDSMDMN